MNPSLEQLNATRMRVRLRTLEDMRLPEYLGSTLRGALGHSFRKVSCPIRCEKSASCLLRYRCAYSVCFETPIPDDATIMRKYPFAPHPFVLEPPLHLGRDIAEGETLDIGLCLIGRGSEFLPHFIYSFEELGNRGLGRQQAKARLIGVYTDDEEGDCIYNHAAEKMLDEPEKIGYEHVHKRAQDLCGKKVRMRFVTPTRIMSKGDYTSDPSLGKIVPGLMRRIHSLSYFHCGGPADVDPQELLAMADNVKLLEKKEWEWMDWERYSNRQQTKMKLGGFLGEAIYDSIPLPLMVYLVWGELLHIGKASAFGLGQYVLSSG